MKDAATVHKPNIIKRDAIDDYYKKAEETDEGPPDPWEYDNTYSFNKSMKEVQDDFHRPDLEVWDDTGGEIAHAPANDKPDGVEMLAIDDNYEKVAEEIGESLPPDEYSNGMEHAAAAAETKPYVVEMLATDDDY